MNQVRKRLKLDRGRPHTVVPTSSSSSSSTWSIRTPNCSPHTYSHDALLLPPLPLSGGAGPEEEEEEGYLLVEEDTTDSSLVITMDDSQQEAKTARRKAMRKKRKVTEEAVERGRVSESEEEEAEVEVEIDRQLDQALETKSKQHNLTTVNVRNILHEVITNEHVVAMMKAAINETEAVPPFEPKMTRSRFKEVVERGVVIPAWNISPIKKTSDINKAPQFVDIPLAEEDSSDEEYRPDEEEEDETAEDTFQESDMESTASSPRGSRLNRMEEDSNSPWQTCRSRSRRHRVGLVSMGPPPPPKALPSKAVTDSTFLEKLHAVEEELAVCMEPYQPLSESEDEVGLMAYRTRSKRPLRDVPLGRLEAELRAPDITPDMYDSSSAPEDREWTDWLRGLMSSDVDNEEECDDEDDPEYNFLADIDEPDVEDYRDDKAVRITKKEVNELMEELFETLKEDLAGQEVDDEGHEEEEEVQEETPTVQPDTVEQHNTSPGDDETEDEPITEARTVKQQLALIRKRRKGQTQCYTQTNMEPFTLTLDARQKLRLQQQLQQHVQLLTQIHLLSSPVAKLQSEAETTRQFLFELDLLAQRGELLMSSGRQGYRSVFRASNLQGALQLLEELRQTPVNYQPQQHKPDRRGHMRCFPVMPGELAWLFATRPVFLYPELLPCANLDPDLYCPRRTAAFTAAEDCLLVLGLRNMEGSGDPTKLVSQFLLRKTLVQVRRRILQCCRPGNPDNIVKAFRYQRVLWPMPVVCSSINPAEQRPPVEREERVMPMWLVRSLPVIYSAVRHFNRLPDSATEATPPSRVTRPRHSQLTFLRSTSSYSFPPGTRYPPRLPDHLDFRRVGFMLLQQPNPVPATTEISQTPPPPRVFLHCLHLKNSNAVSATTVSTTMREQIRCHYQTLVSLRRRSHCKDRPAPCKLTEEEQEEESEVHLALSESDDEKSESETKEVDSETKKVGSRLEEVESRQQPVESEHEEMLSKGEAERGVNVLKMQEMQSAHEAGDEADDDSDDEGQRAAEDVAFAQDYLHRVCSVVQVCPERAEHLLQVLDEFLGSSAPPESLFFSLSSILSSSPQLLKDFAAFLTPTQAECCGLLVEQQLFERSRRFLRRLGRSLGEGSTLYQEVVSVLQGSSAPSLEDREKISSLLRLHTDLQQEFWDFFQQLHAPSSPVATVSDTIATDCISQNPSDISEDRETGSDSQEEEEPPVCAKNTSVTSNGEKVIVWTREADRLILTTCQQKGANRKTFRQVSTQLGNKTAQQVSLRFRDLMSLFHSANHRSMSCSSEDQPISRQEAAPD
ncbi:GON-4-like protein [Sphaeramia orbicularis]|uniref:GON-4-like protein n=1 Tax=Sphaeramia orbicularis TaxID=375764 RepID=A0A672ZDC4_9TELE|nr:GON-4-like protein [Sphaeramia orbicularis]